MAINALQVAWLSRLADKKIIRQNDSILEFGPQDVICSRAAVEQYGLRHCNAETVKKVLNEAYDGERPKPVVPTAFYSLFGIGHYRSLDLTDTRSDWLRDCNEPFLLPERFDIVTNFGTAEHVFNIAALFRSVHDALKPGGVALHVLPAFGDVDHGFYNIHPTTYLDLAAANNYTIEDLCYVDRWDIRNRTLEEKLDADFDFDSIPIQMQHLRDRAKLQRMVVDLYAANYNHPKTRQFGPAFSGYVYDYCIVALRKTSNNPFRYPLQGYYGGGVAPSSIATASTHVPFLPQIPWHRPLSMPPLMSIIKAAVRRYMVPLIPTFVRRPLARSVLKTVLRDLALDVSGKDPGLSIMEKWVPLVFARQTYPAPPLNEAVMDQIMTAVETKIARLYNATQLGATIDDLDSSYREKIRRLIESDPAFVGYVADRYLRIGGYYRYESSATQKRVINDLLTLIVHPPISISEKTGEEIQEYAALVRNELSKQPYPPGVVVSSRWQELVQLAMRLVSHLNDPMHIAIHAMARLTFDAGMPVLTGDDRPLRERRAQYDRLHPELKPIGESNLALPGTEIDISGVTFSDNFAQGLGYYHEIFVGLGADARADVVVEIGSGFGKLARILRMSGKTRCMVLVDLPESLVLCFAFLKVNFPNARTHVIRSAADVTPDLTEKYDFIFCSIQQLDNLRLSRIDLLINTYSLGEMQQGSVDHILHCIHTNLKPKHIFSLNTIFTDKNLHFAESGNLGQGNEIVLNLAPEWWPLHMDLIARPEETRYRNEVSVVLERTEIAADDLVQRYLTAASHQQMGSAEWLMNMYFAALWTKEPSVIEQLFEGLLRYHKAQGFTDWPCYDFEKIGEVQFLKRRLRTLR